MIFSRSKNAPRLAHYSAYRDAYLRPDFQFRCAYCLTHEFYFSSGDGGEIDHHRPLNPPEHLNKDFSALANDYGNLYWTCGKCNSVKGNCWPDDLDYASGFRFLDPCVEDHDTHWETRSDGTIISKTNTGRYTIQNIGLNRRRLIEQRRFLYECQQRIDVLELTLARKRPGPERELLENVLIDLRRFVWPPVFEP